MSTNRMKQLNGWSNFRLRKRVHFLEKEVRKLEEELKRYKLWNSKLITNSGFFYIGYITLLFSH